MRRLAVAIVAAMAAVGAAGKTIHRSFRGGFPTVVSEAWRNAVEKGTSAGETRISPRTKVVAYKSIVGKVTRGSTGSGIMPHEEELKNKVAADWFVRRRK